MGGASHFGCEPPGLRFLGVLKHVVNCGPHVVPTSAFNYSGIGIVALLAVVLPECQLRCLHNLGQKCYFKKVHDARCLNTYNFDSFMFLTF